MEIKEISLDALDFRYEKLRSKSPNQEKRLLASLGESGQQSPIVVVSAGETGRYVVIDGHKRARALRKLKADVVKAVISQAMAPEALVMAYQMKAGAGYNVLEEALLVCELCRGCGWTLNQAAQVLDKSKSWISRRLGLVESLPEAVLDVVHKGRIGAYAAMKYLLPLARANAKACEELALKLSCLELTSREIGLICAHYGTGMGAAAKRILEDPSNFLKALKQTKKGVQDPALSEAANRCLNNFLLIGRVSSGLACSLPKAINYDTEKETAAKLWGAWKRTKQCFVLLEETAEALSSCASSTN